MKVWKLIFFMFALWTAFDPPRGKGVVTVLDTIVAVVDNIPITFSQVAAAGKVLEEVRGESLSFTEAVTYVVDMYILEKEAEKRGLKVEDEDVTAAIRNLAEKNGLSYLEFKKRLQEEGLPFDIYKDVVKFEMLRQQYLRSFIYPRVVVSRTDVMDLLEDLKKRGETPLNLILFSGADQRIIEELRRKVSDGKVSLQEAGSQYRGRVKVLEIKDVWLADLHPELRKAVESLSPGEASGIFQINGQWAFAVVVAQKGFKVSEELYKKLEYEAFLKKVNREFRRELQLVRRNYYVEYKPVAGCTRDVREAQLCLKKFFQKN